MILQDNQLQDDTDHHTEQTNDKPNAYRVDDDNLEEKDLKRRFLVSDDDMKKQDSPGMEGTGMGGQNFGQNNLTPSGDDEANPSQTAGYTNEYFRRTQPAEEHPENSNFTDPNQAGQPDYSQAMGAAHNGKPDEENSQTDVPNENNAPHPQQPYREGTADDDGDNKKQVNIPGPNEVPDQQKVGE